VTRRRISLDGAWEFFPDPHQTFSPSSLDNAGPGRTILVPGPWQAQFEDLRHYSGMAWYRKQFRLSSPDFPIEDPEEVLHVIHFGAVDYYAAVYLNGIRLGEHEGGYLPFEFSMTPLDTGLKLEEPNELIVQVIDPGNDADVPERFSFAEIPHGKQSWYGPIGGLWQSVYIEARPRVHLTRLRLTGDVPGSRVHALTSFNHPVGSNRALRFLITDPTGAESQHVVPLDSESDELDHDLPIPEPMLWDIQQPNLYRVEAELLDLEHPPESAPLDRLSETFGLRTITTSADGHLVLNGQVLYLRGALDQDYYPELIYTPFSDAELEAQFQKAKHMGLNCLRTHIKITDPRYYDAADRVGLLIWTELPNWQDLTESAKRRARETLAGMVERDWNHPSIIIWTIINEGWGVDLAVNTGHRKWLAETYAFLKNLDPTRLVVGNSPCFTNFHVVTDIEDFHNYYAMPDHYREWRDWVRTFAGRPPWTFAHVVENIDAWREFVRDPWNPVPRQATAEVKRTGSEPMVVSEFGNWGLPDVAKLRDCYGGKEPWWFETGIEWGDGVVYPHGVEQRYRAYHLDKVFPTLSDLSAASQRAQFTALKYEIEEMRRHPSIVGYIITEFTDVHWESNGLLDMCRNPKAYYDVIGLINSADAIVPDWERIAFWEGERCEVRLALSHFSPLDLRECRLEWYLHGRPEVRGSFEHLQPQRAQVTTLGTVVFDVPPLTESCRDRLELKLMTASGKVVSHNHHELYFFPRPSVRAKIPTLHVPGLPRLAGRLEAMGYPLSNDPTTADVMIVEALTDEVRWFIQQGGRVLWLAETSESLQTYVGSLGIAQRRGRSWQGDWASSLSWIRTDKIFRDLPTGGLVDFAFADLTPESVIVGLSPRDFASSVHAGLFVGWIHHTVALVAERLIDKGRLLISTFRLREQLGIHPVASIMMRDMIDRLATAGAEQEDLSRRDSPPDLNRLVQDQHMSSEPSATPR
jgi:hypothetical protein